MAASGVGVATPIAFGASGQPLTGINTGRGTSPRAGFAAGDIPGPDREPDVMVNGHDVSFPGRIDSPPPRLSLRPTSGEAE